MTSMNSFENKSFLSSIRGGDFAHPGEEEAIDLVLSYIKPKLHETVLDAGCGLGATADTIGKKTGAIVVGVDLDADAMAYANGPLSGRAIHPWRHRAARRSGAAEGGSHLRLQLAIRLP